MATPTYEDVIKLTRDAQAMGLYDASPEFLASMLGISPKQYSAILASGGKAMPEEAPASKTLTPEEAPQDLGGGGKGEAGTGKDLGAYGPMSSQLSGTLSNLSNMASLASTIGPALGIGALGALGPLGTVLGMGPLASSIASMFGVEPGYDPTLTDIDVQGQRDYFGAYAAEKAAQRNAANRSMKETAELDAAREVAEAAMSPEGGRAQGKALGQVGALDPSIFGGVLGPQTTSTIDTDPTQSERSASRAAAAADYAGGIMGGEFGGSVSGGLAGVGGAPGDSPGGTAGGQGGASGSAGGTGNDADGQGGNRRFGGVDVIHKPTTLQFGETKDAAPETVISIPKSMKMSKKGKGKKKEVMRGLAQELKELGKGSYLEELMTEALSFLGEK